MVVSQNGGIPKHMVRKVDDLVYLYFRKPPHVECKLVIWYVIYHRMYDMPWRMKDMGLSENRKYPHMAISTEYLIRSMLG